MPSKESGKAAQAFAFLSTRQQSSSGREVGVPGGGLSQALKVRNPQRLSLRYGFFVEII